MACSATQGLTRCSGPSAWPLRVVGSGASVAPVAATEARSPVEGVVEQVLVAEGEWVERGAPVARLRDVDRRNARDAALAAAASEDRAATLATARGDAALERIHRLAAGSWRREAAVIEEQLRQGVIRAPVDGIVLTARPERRVGTSLAAGAPVVAIGRTDTLELELGVAQHELVLVRPGQEVRLRVDALPGRTFTGRVASLAELPTTVDGVTRFPVRALVPNADRLLRPGMAVHARVLAEPASAATRLLRGPARSLRIIWWRLWS